MGLRDQIGDVDEPENSKESVTVRVKDWLKRLDALFGEIRRWAWANGWKVEDGAPVPMREELMERFAVPESGQPSLSLRSVEGAEIWIKPKGLWVIGANGRVDLYSRKGAFTLVDVADAFQKPDWVLHRVGNGKTDGQAFEPQQLADLV
jgi:hypothetical protein